MLFILPVTTLSTSFFHLHAPQSASAHFLFVAPVISILLTLRHFFLMNILIVELVVSELFLPHELEMFRREGVVDRCGYEIKTFPIEIFQLTDLHHLFLADNELETFPMALCQLVHLEVLDLSRNKIKVCSMIWFFHAQVTRSFFFQVIPMEIYRLDHLEQLILSRNRISEIPEELGALKNLKVLNLSSNLLSTLPSTIFRLGDSLTQVRLHLIAPLPVFLTSSTQLLLLPNPFVPQLTDIIPLGMRAIADYFNNLPPSIGSYSRLFVVRVFVSSVFRSSTLIMKADCPFDIKLRWVRNGIKKYRITSDGDLSIFIHRKTLLQDSLPILFSLDPMFVSLFLFFSLYLFWVPAHFFPGNSESHYE